MSASTRDFFTAGGQKTIVTPSQSFEKMPQVIYKVAKHKDKIRENIIENASNLDEWIDDVAKFCKLETYCTRAVLKAIFQTQ